MGDHEFGQGLKMAATAVASAVVVATLVIAVGGPMLERRAASRAASTPSDSAAFVRTGG